MISYQDPTNGLYQNGIQFDVLKNALEELEVQVISLPGVSDPKLSIEVIHFINKIYFL